MLSFLKYREITSEDTQKKCFQLKIQGSKPALKTVQSFSL